MTQPTGFSQRPLRVAVLGSTGSVGVNTLDVIARHPERFEVIGLSAHRRIEALAAQCVAVRPRVAVVADHGAADALRRELARPRPPAPRSLSVRLACVNSRARPRWMR